MGNGRLTLLHELEWSGYVHNPSTGNWDPCCPLCHADSRVGGGVHEEGCALARAISDAETAWFMATERPMVRCHLGYHTNPKWVEAIAGKVATEEDES